MRPRPAALPHPLHRHRRRAEGVRGTRRRSPPAAGKRARRTLAAGRVAMSPGSKRVRLRLNRYGRRVLRRHARRGRRVRLTFTVNDGDGASAAARRTVRLLRARKKKR